jgi:hypothetical protein
MKGNKPMTAIPNNEPLADHIKQNGITYGPKKLELMRKACELRDVPEIGGDWPTAMVKIFDPCGSWTWFISEWDSKTDECYGLVHGFEKEYGSFSLRELSEVKGALGIGLEVDVWFTPIPLHTLE